MNTVHFLIRAIAVAIVSMHAACTSPKQTSTGEPLPPSKLAPYQACQTDSDCVWVQNGCCDCANGGEDIAIARNQEAAFRAQFSCQGVGCTEVDREPACGTGSVACKSGRCAFLATAP